MIALILNLPHRLITKASKPHEKHPVLLIDRGLIMQWSQFLQDENKDFSSVRLVLVTWALGILTVWAYVSVTKGDLQPLDQSLSLIMGILMTGKVAQKQIEVKSEADKQKPEAPPSK